MKTLINLLLQEQSDLGLQRLLRSFCPKTYNRYGRCKILFPVSINKNWAACVSPSITINWLFSCNTLHLMSHISISFRYQNSMMKSLMQSHHAHSFKKKKSQWDTMHLSLVHTHTNVKPSVGTQELL